MDFLNLLKAIVFSLLGILLAAVFCIYIFKTTEILSYRLVAIFLSLIFVSNSVAKLLSSYFESKT